MLYQMKRKIKKNKILYALLKQIYKPVHGIREIPHTIKLYKKAFKKISTFSLIEKKVWFIGIPLHPNLGDQAQYYCILNWLSVYYKDYTIVEIPDQIVNSRFWNILYKLKQCINHDDFFVFQSGYRTSDAANIWGNLAQQTIVKAFPNHKVLVFPQTVYFLSEGHKANCASAYNQHFKTLFLARDEISYEYAKNMFASPTLALYPDIVTSLIGKYHFQNERNGILFCFRKDGEKYYEDTQLQTLVSNLGKIVKTTVSDTTLTMDMARLSTSLKETLETTFEDFSKYKLIITDRYHGTIFSLIAGTPVIVLQSSDHKLSSGVRWFKSVFENKIVFAASLEEAYTMALEMLKKKYTYEMDDIFDREYYQTLQEKFEKLDRK